MKTPFSREELFEMFDYLNGVLIWKRTLGRQRRGIAVYSLDGNGYLQFVRSGKKMKVHHAVAEMFLDKPDHYDCVDHINRDRLDNRKENLRYTSSKFNAHNTLISDKRNKSGVRGVHKKIRSGTTRYYARIFAYGKHISLGAFDNEHDAGAAYIEAKKKMHEGFVP